VVVLPPNQKEYNDSLSSVVSRMNDYDLCLIMCPPWDVGRPPINIAYLAEFMRAKGYRVWTKDLNVSLYNEVGKREFFLRSLSGELRRCELSELWEVMSQNELNAERMTEIFFTRVEDEIDRWVDEVLETGARYLGFSIHYRNVSFTDRIVQKIREKAPDRIIIYGGPEVAAAFSMNGLQGLEADVFVVGEGEMSLLEFVERHRASGELPPIDGVVYKLGGRLTDYKPRALISDLDALSYPTYDYFDLADYNPIPSFMDLPYLLSRGCTGNCSFCMDHYMAGKFRSRSAHSAVEEIKHHLERYGIYKFHFNDLICNGNPKALSRFCDMVIEEGLRIRWTSYAVVHPKMTPELFEKMRAAGCVSLNFGLESASDRVLKRMNKYYNSELAERVIRDSSNAGIDTNINIIVGFPGETRKDFEDTLNFIRRNKNYINMVDNLSTLMLSPGTLITKRPELFNVTVESERSTWHDDVGNTIEIRNHKLKECQHLLESLKIPLGIINQELVESSVIGEIKEEDDWKTAVGYAVQSAIVRIRSLTFLDSSGQKCTEFKTGDEMTVSLEFEALREIRDPLFRVQIFGKNSQNDTVFLFGMNTARANVDIGHLGPGCGRAELAIGSLNLLSGEYWVEAGIWPSEDAYEPYHVVAHGTGFIVRNPGSDQAGMVSQPTEFAIEEGGAESQENYGQLGIIDLKDKFSKSEKVFETLEDIVVEAVLGLEQPERFYLSAQLFLLDGLIHQVDWRDPLPRGRSALAIRYSPLLLLEGSYMVQLALMDKKADCSARLAQASFEVRSKREQGGGLVFMPSEWVIEEIPKG